MAAAADANGCDKELISFLHDKSENSSFKSSALFCVLGLTASKEGVDHIVENGDYLPVLCVVASEKSDHSSYAHNSLINIASYKSGAAALISMKKNSFFNWILDGILDQEALWPDLKCHILANVARFKMPCEELSQWLSSNSDKFMQLLSVFCNTNSQVQSTYDFLSSVFCNLTQTPTGRKLFMRKENALIEKLLPYVIYMDSAVRRTNVVRALKNCCFDLDYHDWLLNEVAILPTLLLPLAGPEQFDDDTMETLPLELQYLDEDKKREPSPLVRKMLIEAITKLCATKNARALIKNSGTYYIMRELHKSEKDPVVSEACENLINILIGDEPEEGMENLMEIKIPEEIEKSFEACREVVLEEEYII